MNKFQIQFGRTYSLSILSKGVLLYNSRQYTKLIGWRLGCVGLDVQLGATCDRYKQAAASLSHIFWKLPKLYHFWQWIFNTFSKMLQEPCIYATGYASKYVNMLAFCILLEGRLIPFSWNDPVSLIHPHWIKKIIHYLKLEKISYSLQESVLRFYAIWQPFLTFLEQMEAENVSPLYV